MATHAADKSAIAMLF